MNSSFARRAVLTRILATIVIAVFALYITGCQSRSEDAANNSSGVSPTSDASNNAGSLAAFSYAEVPPYSGELSVEINGNVPYFSDEELNLNPLEYYSDLDPLGRCGMAVALVGLETMPNEPRGSIGMIKPTGWQISEYDWIDGKYLFNRCHLIAYSLAAENDNPLNLITGTRAMNTQGMLPYEERVVTYIDQTGNHVLYRVTPVFEGDNMVASGVLMEAKSIEDGGSGICFCVWCYNIEPGVVIDYTTGDNWASDSVEEDYSSGEAASQEVGADNPPAQSEQAQTYILNTNTHRFHYPDCPSVSDIKEKNKKVVEASREEILEKGYEPCGACKP